MSKFCETCGTELANGALFCPSCGKTQSDESLQTAVSAKKGPLALPRNGLALTAAILVLAGAIFSNGNWIATLIQSHFQSVNVLWTVEVFLIFATAATLFIGYFARITLKVPMVMWGVTALIGFVSNLVTALKLWPTKLAAGRIGTFYFVIGLLTAAAALFAILYAFKALKKIPALVVLGVLLSAVLIMGVAYGLRNFVGYLSVNDKNTYLIMRTLYNILYSLIFPVGIFLTVLSAKEKPTKLC